MPLAELLEGIRLWKDIRAEGAEDNIKRKAAIELVIEAVLATKAYLYDKENGYESRAMERLLSEKWWKAATAIRDYDHALFKGAEIKALGWADPREWVRSEGQEHIIVLSTILEQCEYIRDKDRRHYR